MPDRRIFCIVALFIMLLLSHCGPQGQSILGKTGPNLIKNSSFETGIKSPDEWQIVTGADKEMPVMRWGDYHNKPERFISVELSKPAIAGWQQKVQLEPDGWYKLSASVKAEEVEGQGLGAAIVFSNFRWMQFPALKGTTEWQRMEAELINAGFTQMDLVCSLGAFGMNSGYAMFDDVSLVRMADPAVRDDLTREITIGSFKLRYDKERGYLTSLKPVDDAGKSLEFLGSYPTLPYLDRDKDCFLGDLTLVVRQRDSWEKLSTARSRHRISDGRHGLEIRNTFEEKKGFEITSEFKVADDRKDMIWTINLSNPGDAPLEIGGLELPFHWNTNYCLFDPHDKASQKLLYTRRVAEHKHIGGNSSYVTVEPMDGSGPSLLIVPGDPGTSFEMTYHDPETIRKTRRDPDHWIHGAWPGLTRIDLISKGMLEYRGFSTPFAPPSSLTIPPKQTRRFMIRFHWIDTRDSLPKAMGELNLLGIEVLPGCALPADCPARMLIHGAVPPLQVKGLDDWVVLPPADDGFKGASIGFSLKSNGPVNVEISDSRGVTGRAMLYGLPPLDDLMKTRARFIVQKQVLALPGNPLHLAVLCYDNQKKSVLADINDMWGSGGYEGGITDAMFLALKNVDIPDAGEIKYLEHYIGDFLIGGLQDPYDMGVAWMVGKPARKERGYNYIHVMNLYEAMARGASLWPGLYKKTATDYLEIWEKTFLAFNRTNVMFQDLGLMGRGNFTTMPELFRRFALEGAAKNIELEIAKWSQYWNEEPGYPYGSELFYDNTGYESVFFYARAGGFNDLARRTVRVTLAGRGQAPCWFWNDSDQRWWDAVRTVPEYAQFTDFGENCHHYMTGLNGWMLLEAFESGMTDNSTRPAGFSGVLNSWARVHPDGFASMCYCPDPSSDNYGFNQFSGDVGLGLWGNLKAARCIVVDNPVLGRLVYGGKPIDDGDSPESVIQIQPMAGMRHRVRFMDPVLYVDSEGPEIKKIRWDTAAMKIDIDLENRFETACQAWITITGNLPDELECRFEDVRGRVEPKIDLRRDGGKWVIRKEIAPATRLVCRLIPATGQDQ